METIKHKDVLPNEAIHFRESHNCYKIIGVKLEHNHNISPRSSKFINQLRKIEPHVKKILELFDVVDVKTNESLIGLATETGGVKNMACLPRDFRNHVHNLLLRLQEVS